MAAGFCTEGVRSKSAVAYFTLGFPPRHERLAARKGREVIDLPGGLLNAFAPYEKLRAQSWSIDPRGCCAFWIQRLRELQSPRHARSKREQEMGGCAVGLSAPG